MTISVPTFLFSNNNSNIQTPQNQTPQTVSPLSSRPVSSYGYDNSFNNYSCSNNNSHNTSNSNYIDNNSNNNNINMAINTNTDAYNAGVTSLSAFGEKRIRTPHPHDVLSGRGGGINAHSGNMQFREWVRVRKNDYNLASSKTEKARVAKEVIDLVQAQNPPGRFLTKDTVSGSSSGGWWIEVDEERAMAKTAQALREGAPQIRAAHRDEIEHTRGPNGRKARKRAVPQITMKPPTPPSEYMPPPETLASLQQKAVNDLRANVESAKRAFEMQDCAPNSVLSNKSSLLDASKRQKLSHNGPYVAPWETTPTMSQPSESSFDLQSSLASFAVPSSMLAPPPPAPQPLGSRSSSQFKRVNSLALSDFSISEGWIDSGFINPFEDEADGADGSGRQRSNLYPGIYRNSSSSMSDLAGLNALFKSNESSKASTKSNSSLVGSRSTNNFHHLNSNRNNGNNSSSVLLSQPGINSAFRV